MYEMEVIKAMFQTTNQLLESSMTTMPCHRAIPHIPAVAQVPFSHRLGGRELISELIR